MHIHTLPLRFFFFLRYSTAPFTQNQKPKPQSHIHRVHSHQVQIQTTPSKFLSLRAPFPSPSESFPSPTRLFIRILLFLMPLHWCLCWGVCVSQPHPSLHSNAASLRTGYGGLNLRPSSGINQVVSLVTYSFVLFCFWSRVPPLSVCVFIHLSQGSCGPDEGDLVTSRYTNPYPHYTAPPGFPSSSTPTTTPSGHQRQPPKYTPEPEDNTRI